MPNPENLIGKGFKPGESGNPDGRPVGAKNRSTIARKVLEMTALYKDEAFRKLQEQYPGITKDTTVEEMMTIVMANKAITEADHNAYKALQDSAYGAPKAEIDHTTKGEKITGFMIVDVDGSSI